MESNYFKCKSDDYASFKKGGIYHKNIIDKSLLEYPEDWVNILDYPSSIELINCIEKGENKAKILKALKQWSKTK